MLLFPELFDAEQTVVNVAGLRQALKYEETLTELELLSWCEDLSPREVPSYTAALTLGKKPSLPQIAEPGIQKDI